MQNFNIFASLCSWAVLFDSNPVRNPKDSLPTSMQCRATIGQPAKCHPNGGPIMAAFISRRSPILWHTRVYLLFAGQFWRCIWGTWRCTIRRLCVEKCLQLLRVWQELLLQTHDPSLWYLYRSWMGLRVRHVDLQPRVVLDPYDARPFYLLRMLHEVL